MAASSGRGRVVGEYQVGRRIGSGSFSVVWHARHRVHGTEVAIKEIVMSRLNKKLQDSLVSEIYILKRINHPNIIRLHDIIEVPGRIHIVLEYCKGGDLSMYIQRCGRVPEATTKNFMQQLGIMPLKVLRENNLIHRDLKPQNLLLSTDDNSRVLKIADFGFARSLQPRGLAETLCGSPLYMAPEIMQLQKYDAKADLWSVGAILFQLVTGKTPFTGNNQIQLLQNIVKSTELQFPPDSDNLSTDCKDLCRKLLRRNPVERLTFDEFFNHPFVSQKILDEPLRSRMSSRLVDGFPLTESIAPGNAEDSGQEDCLPFFLDDDSSGPEGISSFSKRRSSMDSRYGKEVCARESSSKALNSKDFNSRHGSAQPSMDNTLLRSDGCKLADDNIIKAPNTMDQRVLKAQSRVMDSLDMMDQDYVLVFSPPLDVSCSSARPSRPSHAPCKSPSPPQSSVNLNAAPSAPMPITGAVNTNDFCIKSLDSLGSAPGTSQESMDMGDASDQPSTHCMTRIKSLQQCASAIMELVNEKIGSEKQLEAFSIQLVILAIWKQALHICHTQAASASEGSSSPECMRLRSSSKKYGTSCEDNCPDVGPESIPSQIEREFLREVEHAEELAKAIEPGSVEMPDAMEMIFQSALSLGRNGGVDELMGDMEKASHRYSKAVRLLVFLLVEAPSLILNPPFSLTISDRYRLRTYIDILNYRKGHPGSQRIHPPKGEDQEYLQ